MLTLLTKLQSDKHDRHHMFDSFSGEMIIGYRLIMLAVFLVAVFSTYKRSMNKIKVFILIFGMFGALYIAAIPLIVVASNHWIEAKDRN
jgi:hypothetical protein